MTDPHLFRMALLRWLDIIGTIFFLGSVAFRQLTFLPSIQTTVKPAARKGILENEDVHTATRLWFILLYLFTLHLFILVYPSEVLSGRSLTAFFSAGSMDLINPYFGWIWGIKLLLLSALMLLLRSGFTQNIYLLFGGGCLLCLMGSLSGHAVSRDIYAIILTDWLHYTAVSVWAGGLIPLRGVLGRTRKWIDPDNLAPFLSRIISTFSVWAVLCVVTIIVTGSFNAMIYLVSLGTIIEPQYGKILILKLCFVLVAFGLGGVSRFYILPRVQKSEQAASSEISVVEKLFHRAVTVEIGFVVGVLIFAAVLTQTSLP